MITEMCMNMGWTDCHVLKMPMIRFSVMLKHMRKIKARDQAMYFTELCDIQSISLGSGEHYKAIRDSYRKRAVPTKQAKKLNAPRVFDTSDKAQADAAAEILKKTFEQKAKLKL